MRHSLLFITALVLIISGCSNSKQSTETAFAMDLAAMEIMSEPTYRAARTRKVDLIHTSLKLSFDWEQQYVYGEAELTLQPYFYLTDQVVLDAKGQEIQKVELKTGTSRRALKYKYEYDVLTIYLDRNYARGEDIQIYIKYIAKPEERLLASGSAISDDKGLYFIDPLDEDPNHPTQIWTQGETEANSVWFPTIDSPNERCTHDIELTVDSNFTTLSNGTLVSSISNSDGTRTDKWVQSKPIAPYLFMLAIGDYAIVKDSYGNLEVNYYVDPPYAPYAREIFKNTPEMIGFYSDLLGYDYPWSKYHQVIAHEYVSGAMENVSAVIFGEFVQLTHQEMIDGDYEEVVAHELFHHWFGDVVTCESWANLPLNESFATYGEYLWFEHKYGAMRADAHLHTDLQKYLYEVEAVGAFDLIRFEYQKPDDMFDSHSYAKGGRILHMLRLYVGDEAFFESLELYLKRHEFSAVEIHQLRLAFEEVTGEDLNWFFNQWFMGKGHPDLDISYNYDPETKMQYVHVEQLQDSSYQAIFKLPVQIDIYSNNGVQSYDVVMDSRTQDFEFQVDQKPDFVNFDAQKMLVCTKNDRHSMSEMAFLYAQGPRYMDKLEAIEFAYDEQSDLSTAKEVIMDAMMDKDPNIRQEAVSMYDKFDQMKDLQLKDVLVSLMANDPESNVRAEATAALYDYYPWSEGMGDKFLKQLEDSSYLVTSEVLRGIAITDQKMGVETAADYEESPSNDILLTVCEVYSVFGDASKNEFFKKVHSKFSSYESFMFMRYYGDYLRRMDDLKIQRDGVAILEKNLSKDKTYYVRYVAMDELSNLQLHYTAMAKAHKKAKNTAQMEGYEKLINQITTILVAQSAQEGARE